MKKCQCNYSLASRQMHGMAPKRFDAPNLNVSASDEARPRLYHDARQPGGLKEHPPRSLLMQFLLRFVIGGLVVSLFAMFGDALKPKSFAGLFGAAPSVALATLAITVASDGKAYASSEACSMIAGAVALGLYAWLTMQFIVRWRWHRLTAALIALAVWFGCALGIWLGVLR